jgi:hypothetical protein
MWCDIAETGAVMRLTFRASAGSREFAEVTAYRDLCGLVNVVIDGRPMPALDGAQTLMQRAMAIVGFRWPDFPAPGPTSDP